ncbi:hypothetical protein PF010_g15253 [Phytophthora fragariae]|uniref:Uncharacterized protein n=1 Tax=Phytophthora fragariae TaxID=53985 RepID=A0A6A3YA04_9STRA|nr:hypothetical protein PF003_g17670 [Phytophthora fragariae]KAE8942381.1 hypothetical protein PF009_g7857 [Phytophthora fragariae]KAE8996466.1 hypothetical protein PF011_g15890 [Phytophthora fragariae]KAE9099301.1 hypothetical protein PF010_g15253 [Phytophthora fragariae]KAE9149000.1 hypothetical protein PF006_g6479 [Phytophthora fragariae]
MHQYLVTNLKIDGRLQHETVEEQSAQDTGVYREEQVGTAARANRPDPAKTDPATEEADVRMK